MVMSFDVFVMFNSKFNWMIEAIRLPGFNPNYQLNY